MTLAPLPAASRTSSATAAIFSLTSSVKASWRAATATLLIPYSVMPAKARIQAVHGRPLCGIRSVWIPAFAGMTGVSRRNLLTNAMEAAAAGQYIIGAESHRLAAGEQGTDRFHGGIVIGRAVEGNHDRRIAD